MPVAAKEINHAATYRQESLLSAMLFRLSQLDVSFLVPNIAPRTPIVMSFTPFALQSLVTWVRFLNRNLIEV